MPPLHRAVCGNVCATQVVFGDIGDLEPKVNLMEMKDRRGFTPLVEATYMGRREIVDDLMRAGAHCNQEVSTLYSEPLCRPCGYSLG